MFQFQRSQNPDDPVQNVVFYGETTEYIRLTHALEQMDIQTSLLGVPPTVSGYENYEFQEYANAIGAMFKSNKEYERINLLEVDAAAGKSSAGSAFALALLGSAVISAGIVGAICLFFSIQTGQYNSEKQDIREWIDSAETQGELTKVDEAQVRLDKLKSYSTEIQTAHNNYQSIPMLSTEMMELLESYTEGTSAEIFKWAFNNGTFSLTLIAEDTDGPSAFIENAINDDFFANVTYEGFTYVAAAEDAEGGILTPEGYSFETTLSMQPVEIPEEESDEGTEEAGTEETQEVTE
jgi:type IV pilus assembly protein PilM